MIQIQLLVVFLAMLSTQLIASPLPIQLAVTMPKDIPISQYLVSEKLDGVRGYWNGKDMLTRSGRIINIPSWFVINFPEYALDGELWAGRNSFEQVSALVRTKKINEDKWRKIKFMVFDLPSSTKAFASRYQDMLRQLTQLSPYLRVVEQKRFPNLIELKRALENITDLGGEGLMLHHQKSLYQRGRNKGLIKLKRYFDAEAKVIKHIAGKGKYQGMLGAIEVKTSKGITFKVGSGFSDKQRQYPPAVGSIITYQYLGYTIHGTPKFASFLRVKATH